MPRALVLGSPIGHSLSPVLHRAAYASLGLTDWTYAACQVDMAGFGAFVAGLGGDVRGLSLTMPLKEVAFTVAASVSGRASSAGAINTLVRRADGGWHGDNTDIAGIVAALAMRGSGGAMVLGAGATARSALIALCELGWTEVTVCARNRDKALASLGSLVKSLDVELTVREIEAWPDIPARRIVSTLPVAGALSAASALAERPAELTGTTLLDVVYADWPTPLARAAESAGASVVSGLDMLVHQAVEQVELMTGRRPDPNVLFDAIHAAASGRDGDAGHR